jgi:hypothetical protein
MIPEPLSPLWQTGGALKFTSLYIMTDGRHPLDDGAKSTRKVTVVKGVLLARKLLALIARTLLN